MYKIMMHNNAKITCSVGWGIKEACCCAQPQAAEAASLDAQASILRHRPPNASLSLLGGQGLNLHQEHVCRYDFHLKSSL